MKQNYSYSELEVGKIYATKALPGEVQKDKDGRLWYKDTEGKISEIRPPFRILTAYTYLRDCTA